MLVATKEKFIVLANVKVMDWLWSGGRVFKKDADDVFHEYGLCPITKKLDKKDKNCDFTNISYDGFGYKSSCGKIYVIKDEYRG